ncbi:hypothetical protein [Niallia endozanthoxylica]|uniref:Uncharacterized protein n=1 Tax=Niallia endozanthoxylica TaxID=2036016 RepID=A0A5J5GYA8_9BACI|nr:hypothetical protein [Niallia endozanthoxylica]KAA9012404.1 hypothetical protein F4V44_25760 [Niallia endozanthoxylica]
MEKWDYDFKQLLKSSGRQDFSVMGLEGITDVLWGRNCFFLSVKEIAPEIVEELSKRVFPCFIAVMKLLIEENPQKSVWDLEKIKQSPVIITEEFEQFSSMLYLWGEKYNINKNDHWFFNEIPQILSMWFKNDNYLKERRFIYGGNFPEQYFDAISARSYTFEGNSIQLDDPLDALEKLVNSISYKEWIRPPEPDPRKYDEYTYMEMCRNRFIINRQFYERLGYIEMPKKKKLSHFDWLVLYQIKGMSYMEIANYFIKDTFSEDTIRRGVNSVSNLIGLTLRPRDKGGRPKKLRK